MGKGRELEDTHEKDIWRRASNRMREPTGKLTGNQKMPCHESREKFQEDS